MTESDRMTAGEIRRNYNQAKNKSKQIGILADMNGCKRSDINKIIDGTTDELPPPKAKKYVAPSQKKLQSGVKLADDEENIIIKMYLNGKSPADIADTVKRSITTVRNYIKKYRETRYKEEVENVIFAEEKTAEEREQLAAEITDKLREAPIEVMPREADARVEELVAMEVETAHTLPEGATVIEIASAIMNMLSEEFDGYIVEIKAGKEYYHVRVADKESGNEVQYQKRRTDL